MASVSDQKTPSSAAAVALICVYARYFKCKSADKSTHICFLIPRFLNTYIDKLL